LRLYFTRYSEVEFLTPSPQDPDISEYNEFLTEPLKAGLKKRIERDGGDGSSEGPETSQETITIFSARLQNNEGEGLITYLPECTTFFES